MIDLNTIDSVESYNLIVQDKVAHDDPQYEDVLHKAIQHPLRITYLHNLLDKVNFNPKYYEMVLNKFIEEPSSAYYLIKYNFVLQDSSYYEKVLNKCLKNSEMAFYLLKNDAITVDSPYYEETLKKAIQDPYCAYDLLLLTIKQSSPYYELVLEKCVNGYAYDLLYSKRLLNYPELYEQAIKVMLSISDARKIFILLAGDKIKKNHPLYKECLIIVYNYIYYHDADFALPVKKVIYESYALNIVPYDNKDEYTTMLKHMFGIVPW